MVLLICAAAFLLPRLCFAEDTSARQAAAIARMQAGVEKQADSVRKQNHGNLSGSPFFVLGWATRPHVLAHAPQATGDCVPMSDSELQAIVTAAATEHRIDPAVIRAVIDQESGAKPCATSNRGAQGLMQLMPSTQSDLGVQDPFNPAENVEGGARYLRQLLDRYDSNLSLALAAYNAGPARVDGKGGVPGIAETEDYVSAILEQLRAATRGRPDQLQ